jgi:hypothetical protein
MAVPLGLDWLGEVVRVKDVQTGTWSWKVMNAKAS